MSNASDISQRKRTVILSEAKNLGLFEIDAATQNGDVGKPTSRFAFVTALRST